MDKKNSSFENCISLGWFCGVAASLNRLGLRDFSGPFDWYFSDYESVIKLMDIGFENFFVRENLVEDKENKKTFSDERFGFTCFHDVKRSLDEDYPIIYDKYHRRAERFLKALEKPSCLFRSVRTKKELDYIAENIDYIERVIKRYNRDNQIIYLVDKSTDETGYPFVSYNVQAEYLCDAYSVRTLFDKNAALLAYCSNLIPADRIRENKERYYSLNSTWAAEVYHGIMMKDPLIASEILKGLDLVNDEGIFLWGYGYHGRNMYKYLKQQGINVSGIIDKRADKLALEDVVIYKPDDIPFGTKVFVSISEDEDIVEVIKVLKERKCDFLTYRDLRDSRFGRRILNEQ